MKMVELMAEMVHETMRQNRPIVVSFNVAPHYFALYQRKVLQVDRLPIHLGLRYFSGDEVATLFDIHPRTVRRWAERGWIKRYRPSKNVAYYKGYELFAVNRFFNLFAQ